jgi:hypothetical protein
VLILLREEATRDWSGGKAEKVVRGFAVRDLFTEDKDETEVKLATGFNKGEP